MAPATWSVSIVDVAVILGLPLSDFLPEADPDVTFDVPCLAFLVHNADEVLLVDTGPDAEEAKRQGFTVRATSRSTLVEAVRAVGFAVEDVTRIVHTHLHYDHVQNDHLFPYAQVFVNRRELPHAASRPDRFYLDVADTPVEQLATRAPDRWVLLEGDTELTPGVRVLHTGGHSPGHQSVLVDTKEGTVCISGDITPLAGNADVPPAACPDRAAWARFVARVASEGWTLLPSHDPSFADISFG